MRLPAAMCPSNLLPQLNPLSQLKEFGGCLFQPRYGKSQKSGAHHHYSNSKGTGPRVRPRQPHFLYPSQARSGHQSLPRQIGQVQVGLGLRLKGPTRIKKGKFEPPLFWSLLLGHWLICDTFPHSYIVPRYTSYKCTLALPLFPFLAFSLPFLSFLFFFSLVAVLVSFFVNISGLRLRIAQ